MAPGLHLLHKPVGVTSFSLVRKCAVTGSDRRPRRICHGGTLDPFASGLLLILVEPATRLFDYLHDVPKTYEATVRWGIETDNGDPLGRVTLESDAGMLSAGQLDAAIHMFVGWHEQVPHATSAKRVGGERAYVRAHRGEAVEMPASRVYLHAARWIDHDLPRSSRLRLVVRGGFYVRALARDLGRALGCGAHLAQLHRTAIGPWLDPPPQKSVHVAGEQLLPWFPTKLLTDQEVGDLRAGCTISKAGCVEPAWKFPTGFPPPSPLVRGFHRDKFCFLLKIEDTGLELLTPLRGGL